MASLHTADGPRLAERAVLAIRADGTESVVTLAIGHPYAISPTEWACPVRLDGLHHRLPDVRGIDAWQCLQLCQALLAQLLRHFVDGGGRLYWTGTREPIAFGELMAS